MSYNDQIHAIREMLANPSREIVQDGYELLFKLWLKNVDSPDFIRDLVSIAVKNKNVIEEFENRLRELSLKSSITDTFLKKKLSEIKEILEMKPPIPNTPKIFISYAHRDESFKDEFTTMFAGLQRRGVINAWQDRLIEAGEEWFDAIRNAMNECNIAVLLVSPDFIASSFIQQEELKRLFERRVKEGLRVLPIIIRPCLWQDEPVIKDLQALPKDGKPVISYSTTNGDRDQVWADIGKKIKEIAENL